MARKLRYFVRVDSKGVPVIGSNIARPKKPTSGRWLEIFSSCCPIVADTTISDDDSDLVLTMEFGCGDNTFTITAEDVVEAGTTEEVLQQVATFLNENYGYLGSFYVDEETISVINYGKLGDCGPNDFTFNIEIASDD